MIDFEKTRTNEFTNLVNFFGVVEDNLDPMTLLRVRVRCFGFHPENVEDVPTDTLPWATVLQPTNSASMGGIGDATPLPNGTWVYGFFADGENGQEPYVTHTVPGIHRPSPPGSVGGTSAGFLSDGDYTSGDPGEGGSPYHNDRTEGNGNVDLTNSPEVGEGALTAVGDINMMLQPKDAGRFSALGLNTYSAAAAPNGYACKDGRASLKFHYGTALAFEKLTKEYGKGKLSITSAYRTPAYNSRVGGAKGSLHVQGRALDISLDKIGKSQGAIAAFAKLAVKNGFVGFGVYNSFIHIDTGTGRVWNGAKAKWFTDAISSVGWYAGKKGLSGVRTSSGTPAETATTSPEGTTSTGSVVAKGASQERVYQALKAKGYREHEIAGIMANFEVESGFNPGAVNPNDRGRRSTGLAQWRAEREAALFAYTKTRSPSIEQQVDFMHHEMQTTHAHAFRALRGTSNPQDAAYEFGRTFEVYQGHRDRNSPSSRKRIEAAGRYYDGNVTPTSTPKGFIDPTNSYPSPEYRGEPSTNHAVRGFNSQSNQHRILTRDAGRMTGIPIAGNMGTFGEPELTASPQYPYNSVRSSLTGHLLEFDDSPGSERINIEHRTGSGMEIFSDGHTVYRSKGNSFDMNEGDSYLAVGGKYFATSVNDMNIRTTADMTQHADGSVNIIVGNDGTLLVSGDYSVSVGEDVKIRAVGGKVNIQAQADVDILSNANVNIEAKAALNLKGQEVNIESLGNMNTKVGGNNVSSSGGKTTVKAGGSFVADATSVGFKSSGASTIQSAGNISFSAPTVYLDDVVRLAEGNSVSVEATEEAQGNEGADTADIGTPPGRSVINKDNLNSTTNSGRVITTSDTADFYSNV